MPKRALQLLLIACLATSTSWAADNPFVGKWKLNPEKSHLTDQMKVASLGANKYTFDFGGGYVATVVADGTDQPAKFGTTMSVISEGPNTWKFVGKKDGRIRSTATWRLSEDGKTLTDARTVYQPNGSPLRLNYRYERTAGTYGLAGTWESSSEKVNSVFEIVIQSYKEDGLSFINPAQKSTQNMEFDGKDYPNQGPNVFAGSASSGHRVNESTLDITDKVNGKSTVMRQLKLSPDLQTLTVTVQPVDRSKPNILVFDRQ
jgi:hypothetical protein